jgi:hypothetical protein
LVARGTICWGNELGVNIFSPAKNEKWLFIGEADAGERSAVLYTIVECSRHRGFDP